MNPRNCRRLRALVFAMLPLLALLALGIEAILEHRDRRLPAHGGALIATAAGDRLYTRCTGAGTPTIVLDAGATGFAATWAWVQADLSDAFRVCSFDRAGLGRSATAAGPVDAAAAARRLEALLTALSIEGPVLLVGHSLGGAHAVRFAADHPERVAGLVLVDPSHPDQLDAFPAAVRDGFETFRRLVRYAALAARVGALRLANPLAESARGLPPPAFEDALRFGASARHLATSSRELAAFEASMAQAGQALDRLPTDLPLTVVSAGTWAGPDPDAALAVLHRLHQGYADRSSLGRHVVVPWADHLSLLMERDRAADTARLIREQAVALGVVLAQAGHHQRVEPVPAVDGAGQERRGPPEAVMPGDRRGGESLIGPWDSSSD